MILTDRREAIPGSLIFGLGIYGIPSVDTYIVVWTDVCPNDGSFNTVDKGADGFVKVSKSSNNWIDIEKDPTVTERCKDAT